MIWLPCGEETITICSVVSIQTDRQTDKQTDGRTLTFLDAHVTLRLTVLEIFAVKYGKNRCLRVRGQNVVHLSLVLTRIFVTPKDIATRMGENRSGTQLYHRANSLAD